MLLSVPSRADTASAVSGESVELAGCREGFANPDPNEPGRPFVPRLGSVCQERPRLELCDCFWWLFPEQTRSRTRSCRTAPQLRRPDKCQKRLKREYQRTRLRRGCGGQVLIVKWVSFSWNISFRFSSHTANA